MFEFEVFVGIYFCIFGCFSGFDQYSVIIEIGRYEFLVL